MGFIIIGSHRVSVLLCLCYHVSVSIANLIPHFSIVAACVAYLFLFAFLTCSALIIQGLASFLVAAIQTFPFLFTHRRVYPFALACTYMHISCLCSCTYTSRIFIHISPSFPLRLHLRISYIWGHCLIECIYWVFLLISPHKL
jgi:hypothetical protein